MLYRDIPLETRRGLPLSASMEFDFAGLDPTRLGASMIMQVRAQAGDAATVLELRSDAGEITAAITTGTSYAVTLFKSTEAMQSLEEGDYVYGLLLSGAGAPDDIVVEGPLKHLPLLATRIGEAS